MESGGVQFGLAHGLIHLRGKEVLLADELLETISRGARTHLDLGKPPISGNFLVDMTVLAAEGALDGKTSGAGTDMNMFFGALNEAMYYTLCRVAERAGLARKKPDRLRTNQAFWDEFCQGAADITITPRTTMVKLQKSLFTVCHGLVKKRYDKNDPGHIRHADLAALFIFNFWNATGLLRMTQNALMDSSNSEENT